jgi:hypothetical protein
MKVLPENVLKRMIKEERIKLGKAGLTMDEINESNEVKSERELQKHCANLLRLREIPFHVSRIDKRSTGTIGWPDFTFALEGKPVAWECKTATGKVRPEQVALHTLMRACGWRVDIIRSVKDAMESLANIGA